MRLALQVSALFMVALFVAGCGTYHTADTQAEAQVTLRVADAALSAGAPDIALRVATIVLDREPGNGAAMVAKGDALYALGEMDQASEVYRAAVAADPDNVAAQMGLGRTLVRTAPQEAEARFLVVLAKQPDNAIALNNLGIARDLQGQHEQAQQAYRQALAVKPEMTEVKTNLALSLSLTGQAVQEAPAHPDTPIATSPPPIAVTESEPLTPKPVEQRGPVSPPQTADDASKPVVIAQREEPVAPKPSTEPPHQQAEASPSDIYVQMGSLDTEQGARAEWQRLRTRWPELLRDHAPAVQQADVSDRTFWRLRTSGFASLSDANDFCEKLRAGGGKCWTVASAARN
jgi:Flp pilus assembly protein TadD